MWISFENPITTGSFASSNLSHMWKEKKGRTKMFDFSMHVNFLSPYLGEVNLVREQRRQCETCSWKHNIDIPQIPIWWHDKKLGILF